jgi:hypothetical protein
LTTHLPHEIKLKVNSMHLDNFIDVFLARYVSDTYNHHQENLMFSCSILFSAPSFWMGGALESHSVGRVYGADGAERQHTHDPHKTTTHPKSRCRKPYAATKHLMFLKMGICSRNMSS